MILLFPAIALRQPYELLRAPVDMKVYRVDESYGDLSIEGFLIKEQLAGLTVTLLLLDYRLEFLPPKPVDVTSLGFKFIEDVEGEKVRDQLVRLEASDAVLRVAEGVVLAG